MLIRAGRYLGAPPWELMGQAVTWVRWAITAEAAEIEAMEAAKNEYNGS